MTPKLCAVYAAILTCFVVACAAGCRTKTTASVAAPQGVEAVKAQARQTQVQQYILKQRKAARKNSRTHTVH